jgi:predicted nucleotidyltransferase
MNRREKEILEGVVEILKRELNPPKIILFGSRAKGNNSEHADFDFAAEVKRPNISVQRKIADEMGDRRIFKELQNGSGAEIGEKRFLTKIRYI